MSPEASGKLGIITALPAEANCLTQYAFQTQMISAISDNTLVLISGIGAQNAAFAAQKLINEGVTTLVSWGTAGSLSENLQPGDIVLPESVQLSHDQIYRVDQNWRQQLIKQITPEINPHGGSLLHSNEVITTAEQKSQLHDDTEAVAVDMESGAVAQIADQRGLPFLIIRSIVDSSTESIPTTAINSIDEFGQTKPIALMTNLIKKPGDIPKLIRLGKHFRLARKSLQQVSVLTGTTLAHSANSEI